jgi:hypothetical protein
MPGVAGFDRAAFPGETEMDWLKANTNFQWCGYYLGGPSFRGPSTWLGKRAFLRPNFDTIVGIAV